MWLLASEAAESNSRSAAISAIKKLGFNLALQKCHKLTYIKNMNDFANRIAK